VAAGVQISLGSALEMVAAEAQQALAPNKNISVKHLRQKPHLPLKQLHLPLRRRQRLH
jgi:hypothetical protein